MDYVKSLSQVFLLQFTVNVYVYLPIQVCMWVTYVKFTECARVMIWFFLNLLKLTNNKVICKGSATMCYKQLLKLKY